MALTAVLDSARSITGYRRQFPGFRQSLRGFVPAPEMLRDNNRGMRRHVFSALAAPSGPPLDEPDNIRRRQHDKLVDEVVEREVAIETQVADERVGQQRIRRSARLGDRAFPAHASATASNAATTRLYRLAAA